MIEHVDPTIGTNGAGNCLIGPYLPQSIVRLGPDCAYPQPTSGYNSTRPIAGFSHNHVSGTGGGSRYGNVRVTPYVGWPRAHVDPYTQRDEQAASGYYRVTLDPVGIEAELTSTPRVGLHRYRFPEGAGESHLLIDVGAVVQREGGPDSYGRFQAISTGGFCEWVTETELVGRGDFKGGWGHHFPYSTYFYAKFETAPTKRCTGYHHGLQPVPAHDGPNCRAVAAFGDTREVRLRVGISYVSVGHARASVERETAGKDFDAVRAEAEQIWRTALGRIRTDGGADEQKTLFYTLFSRLICMPSDLGIDDEFPGWRSGVRHFTDYYALWDSVRNANSLIGLFDPQLEVDMLNCLLDVGEHIGWVPDAWIAGHSAMIQGGSSADVLFCEAKRKGLEGIDYARALRQMRKNAEVRSPDPWLYGRYPDYHDLDFISSRTVNGVSRHLEYSYQDWCIGALAEQLGEAETAAEFYQRAKRLWNHWREDIRFFAPKTPEGAWIDPFDPLKPARPDSWFDPYFYEGPSKSWSFNTQADFAGLVARHGGADGFAKHLDWYFDGGHYGSKETWLHVPFLYHYCGQPWRSADRSRWAMREFFHVARNGLADNEDMGCQSAFYMCSAMGLYPIMGQDLYLLTAPVFESVEIDLGTSGNVLRIEAPGAGPDRPYIAGATLDGQPLDRAWVGHADFPAGATIRYELSDTPTDWATQSPPPSPMAGK